MANHITVDTTWKEIQTCVYSSGTMCNRVYAKVESGTADFVVGILPSENPSAGGSTFYVIISDFNNKIAVVTQNYNINNVPDPPSEPTLSMMSKYSDDRYYYAFAFYYGYGNSTYTPYSDIYECPSSVTSFNAGVLYILANYVSQGDEPIKTIKYLTAEFKYPQAGEPLATSLDALRSDTGEVTAGNITWNPSDSSADNDVSYTATFTVTAGSSAKFAQAIGQDHITIINTADTAEVYIESIEAIQPVEGGNILIVKVTFSPVGQTNPYDETDLESDPLEEPPNPTITAVDTSFFTAYAPSKAQLNSLASYMWNNTDNWLDTFNRMFANPMECILGLSIVPVSVSGTPKNVVFGNVETSISMPAIDSQYVSVNCGSVRLSEQWRTYLDYNPYTKVRIYLPYCGVHEMDTDEIMGKEIAVTYKVDVLNGNVIAYVKDGTQVKWTFSGNCAMQVPITAQQFNNSIHGYAAAAGNQVTNFVKGLGLQPTLNRQEAMQKPGGLLNWAPFTPFASFPSIGSAISAVQGSKSSVVHQGNFSGGVGQLSVQTPFLVIERPRPVMANVYQKFEGFPNFASLPLASCKGFTRVEAIHLEGMTATSEEQAMIENMLKGGVII